MDERRSHDGSERPQHEFRLQITLFLAALLFYSLAVWRAVERAEIDLASLAVYFDGYLYIEIAKSFPLPYATEGRAYLGHAPGYPALIFLLEKILPGGWGIATIAASVLPAAGAVVVFHSLARQLGIRSLWPVAGFAIANARWVSTAGSAHAEGLAMLLVLLCFLDHFRGHRFRSVLWLSMAGMTRFPALLLVAPLALGLLFFQKDRRPGSFAALGFPILVFALFNLYLNQHILDFEGISAAHAVFWDTRISWPLDAWLSHGGRGALGTKHIYFAVTYGFLAFYFATAAIGFFAPRFRRNGLLVLPVWLAVQLLFHLSLDGKPAVTAFTRLVVLAWPAALLIAALALERRIPKWIAGAVILALAIHGVALNERFIAGAVSKQGKSQPFLKAMIHRLDSDEVRWIPLRLSRRGIKPAD